MAESSVNQELMDESAVKQDLLFLVLQFLRESQFNESLHELEIQSRLFFDMKYFEKLLLECKWEEAERYLSGFTKVDENGYSVILFYIIRQLKYFEALDNHDNVKAVEILEKELKFFSKIWKQSFENLSRLLILDNTRERKAYCRYDNDWLLLKAKELIVKNPVLCNKLEFPKMENERLQALLRQSFDDQHSRCKNKVTCPEMKTLLEDHTCDRYAAEQEAKDREELGRSISFNAQDHHSHQHTSFEKVPVNGPWNYQENHRPSHCIEIINLEESDAEADREDHRASRYIEFIDLVESDAEADREDTYT